MMINSSFIHVGVGLSQSLYSQNRPPNMYRATGRQKDRDRRAAQVDFNKLRQIRSEYFIMSSSQYIQFPRIGGVNGWGRLLGSQPVLLIACNLYRGREKLDLI